MTRKARDLDAKRRIKVDDAAAVIAAFRWWANLPPSRNPGRQWAQDVAEMMFEKWSDSPVVLRVDDEFAGALVSANTDVELVPDWLTRFPFNAVAYSLATPLSLHDGQRLCRYLGMVVAGTVSEYRHVGGSGPAPVLGNLKLQGADGRGVFTAYTRIPAAQGVRCMWVYQEEGDPNPQLQSVTFPLRGDLAVTTLADLIETQIEGAHDAGNSDGKELPVLIPLSLSLLLYSAAGDPEIDWPPRNRSLDRSRSAGRRSVTWAGGPVHRCGSTGGKQANAQATLASPGGGSRLTSGSRIGIGSASPSETRTAASLGTDWASKASTGTTNCAGTRRHP